MQNNPVNYIDPEGLQVGYVHPDFRRAIRIINTSPKGRELWNLVKNNELVINIYQGKSHCENVTYLRGDKDGNPLRYDIFVYTGNHDHLKLAGRKDGKRISFTPSLTRVLAHELGHTTGTLDDGGSALGSALSVLFGGENTHNMNNVNKWENPVMMPIDGIERTLYEPSSKNRCGCL